MINNVVLTGRLVKDPELRKTGSGMSVCSFSIAVEDGRKDSEGEKIVYFIGIVAWGKLAEVVCKYTKKGNTVGIVGRLTQRKYTNRQGSEVNTLEVIASNVELMESKNGGHPQEEEEAEGEPVSKNTEQVAVNEDDLPF